MLSFLAVAGCTAVVGFFKLIGIEFAQIAHLWRWGLIGVGVVVGAVAVFLQEKAKRGVQYAVKIEFSGRRAPEQALEVNLLAQSEEDARQQASQQAEEYLGQQGLAGSVQFYVAECRKLP